MRKLAWFSGGFAAACLWACYFEAGPIPLLAAGMLLAAALAAWALTRPRPHEHPILLRRPQGTQAAVPVRAVPGVPAGTCLVLGRADRPGLVPRLF